MKTPKAPRPSSSPSLLAASDVLGTRADEAGAAPGRPSPPGDGAVGLSAPLAPKRLKPPTQDVALLRIGSGAGPCQLERTARMSKSGEEGIARIELTDGLATASEAVQRGFFDQALGCRPRRTPVLCGQFLNMCSSI